MGKPLKVLPQTSLSWELEQSHTLFGTSVKTGGPGNYSGKGSKKEEEKSDLRL